MLEFSKEFQTLKFIILILKQREIQKLRSIMAPKHFYLNMVLIQGFLENIT
jgi:hypothetical protein